MRERLAENHVAVLRYTFLELLLKIAAAVLILAQRWYFALKIFEAHTREAVDYK